MDLLLKAATLNPQAAVQISGSKSETNRLLLLQALYGNLTLQNSSDSDDSQAMRRALTDRTGIVDIHHAGTAMRFLTAYFAIQEGKEIILTGSSRMKERPISILVDALQELGAHISYEGKTGFPPLRIKGKKPTQNKVSLPANVSSQYISALLLIAPQFENGLELTLEGEITSRPYIKMTLALLNEIGVKTVFEKNTIQVFPKPEIENSTYTVESDWSSASYFYAIIALSGMGSQIKLASYKKDSLQGDASLVAIYKNLGVQTVFGDDGHIVLTKAGNPIEADLALDLNASPDLAQTIAVTCFGLGKGCQLSGLHTLKIKETDRLQALQTELTKLGAKVSVTGNSLSVEPSRSIKSHVRVKTYQDHRMAMAFAPLALKTPIIIEDGAVVSKSYPAFWKDLKEIGFEIQEI